MRTGNYQSNLSVGNGLLAEMVVNKAITVEEAQQESDDVDDLMNKLNMRQSLRYAIQSYMTLYQATILENDLNAYCRKKYMLMKLKEDYAIMAVRYQNELKYKESLALKQSKEATKKMSDQEFLDNFEKITERAYKDTMQETVQKEADALLNKVDVSLRLSMIDKKMDKTIKTIEYNIKRSDLLATASMVQLIGESLDIIAKALLEE